MKKERITKSRMATRVSRCQLDPDNSSVTPLALRRAATALGRKLRAEFA